jgi:hypothetical protein
LFVLHVAYPVKCLELLHLCVQAIQFQLLLGVEESMQCLKWSSKDAWFCKHWLTLSVWPGDRIHVLIFIPISAPFSKFLSWNTSKNHLSAEDNDWGRAM